MTLEYKDPQRNKSQYKKLVNSPLVRSVIECYTSIQPKTVEQLLVQVENKWKAFHSVYADPVEVNQGDQKIELTEDIKAAFAKAVVFREGRKHATQMVDAFFQTFTKEIVIDYVVKTEATKREIMFALFISGEILDLINEERAAIVQLADSMTEVMFKIIEPPVKANVDVDVSVTSIAQAMLDSKGEKMKDTIVSKYAKSVLEFTGLNRDLDIHKEDHQELLMGLDNFTMYSEGYLVGKIHYGNFLETYVEPLNKLHGRLNVLAPGEKIKLEINPVKLLELFGESTNERVAQLHMLSTAMSFFSDCEKYGNFKDIEVLADFMLAVRDRVNAMNDIGDVYFSTENLFQIMTETSMMHLYAVYLGMRNAERDLHASEGTMFEYHEKSDEVMFISATIMMMTYGLVDQKTSRYVNDKNVYVQLNQETAVVDKFSKAAWEEFQKYFTTSITQDPAPSQENNAAPKDAAKTQPQLKKETEMTATSTIEQITTLTEKDLNLTATGKIQTVDDVAAALTGYKAEVETRSAARDQKVDDAFKDVVRLIDTNKAEIKVIDQKIDNHDLRLKKIEAKIFTSEELTLLEKLTGETTISTKTSEKVYVDRHSGLDNTMMYVGYGAAGAAVGMAVYWGVNKIFGDDTTI